MGEKNTLYSSSYEPAGCGSSEGAGLYQRRSENLLNFATSAWFLLLSSIIVIIIIIIIIILMNKM